MMIKMRFALSVTTMLVAITPNAVKSEHRLLRRAEALSTQEKVLRELESASGSQDFVGSDGYTVWEKKPCVPFSTISDDQKFHENSDAGCATNDCSGCCRSYHWLLCDSGDSFPSVACICNENTRDPTTFTAAPIVDNFPWPATAQPAPGPTPVPTTPVPTTPVPATPVPTPAGTSQGQELEGNVEPGSTVLLLPGPPQGMDCIPMDQVNAERNHYRTDEGCREDDWGQCEGPCRVFAWLICEIDEDGLFLSQLAKVCGTGTNTTVVSRNINPDDGPF